MLSRYIFLLIYIRFYKSLVQDYRVSEMILPKISPAPTFHTSSAPPSPPYFCKSTPNPHTLDAQTIKICHASNEASLGRESYLVNK